MKVQRQPYFYKIERFQIKYVIFSNKARRYPHGEIKTAQRTAMSSFMPLTVFAPIVLLIAAPVALARPGRRPGILPWLSEGSDAGRPCARGGGRLSACHHGARQVSLLDGPLAIVIRLDAISRDHDAARGLHRLDRHALRADLSRR
jgi:hypothetical protein